MYNKNDPLVNSVKAIMEENDLRRRVEAKLCEELGIYSRNALPREHLANYDALLEQRIDEVKKSLPSYIEKGAKSARDMGNYAGMLQYQGAREKGEEGKRMLDQAKKLDSKSRTRAEYVGKAAKKLAKEELVGNQHKIDANKNNRVDAHDFKLLRAKKAMQEQDDGEETREGGAVTRDGKPVVSPTATRAGETSARRPPAEGPSASQRQALTNKIKDIIKEGGGERFPGMGISNPRQRMDYDAGSVGLNSASKRNPAEPFGSVTSPHSTDSSRAPDKAPKGGAFDPDTISAEKQKNQPPVKLDELSLDKMNAAKKEAEKRKKQADAGDSPVDKKFAKRYGKYVELTKRRMASKMDEEALEEKATPAQQKKVEKVMGEFKKGELHSGSKKGPEVTSRKQAIAIALNQAGLSKKKMEEGFDLDAVMEEIRANLGEERVDEIFDAISSFFSGNKPTTPAGPGRGARPETAPLGRYSRGQSGTGATTGTPRPTAGVDTNAAFAASDTKLSPAQQSAAMRPAPRPGTTGQQSPGAPPRPLSAAQKTEPDAGQAAAMSLDTKPSADAAQERAREAALSNIDAIKDRSQPPAPPPRPRPAASPAARPAATSTASSAPTPAAKEQNPYEKYGANEPDASSASFFRADQEARARGMFKESKSLTSTINKILKG